MRRLFRSFLALTLLLAEVAGIFSAEAPDAFALKAPGTFTVNALTARLVCDQAPLQPVPASLLIARVASQSIPLKTRAALFVAGLTEYTTTSLEAWKAKGNRKLLFQEGKVTYNRGSGEKAGRHADRLKDLLEKNHISGELTRKSITLVFENGQYKPEAGSDHEKLAEEAARLVNEFIEDTVENHPQMTLRVPPERIHIRRIKNPTTKYAWPKRWEAGRKTWLGRWLKWDEPTFHEHVDKSPFIVAPNSQTDVYILIPKREDSRLDDIFDTLDKLSRGKQTQSREILELRHELVHALVRPAKNGLSEEKIAWKDLADNSQTDGFSEAYANYFSPFPSRVKKNLKSSWQLLVEDAEWFGQIMGVLRNQGLEIPDTFNADRTILARYQPEPKRPYRAKSLFTRTTEFEGKEAWKQFLHFAVEPRLGMVFIETMFFLYWILFRNIEFISAALLATLGVSISHTLMEWCLRLYDIKTKKATWKDVLTAQTLLCDAFAFLWWNFMGILFFLPLAWWRKNEVVFFITVGVHILYNWVLSIVQVPTWMRPASLTGGAQITTPIRFREIRTQLEPNIDRRVIAPSPAAAAA